MLIEVDKTKTYYKIVQINTPYRDGKKFTIGEVSIATQKVNLQAADPKDIGGFCISDNEHIFRWIIRGDYLCEVKIPEDSKIYKTESENGIYVSNKILLTNPVKMTDEVALKLYNISNLPESSYFRALAACCIKGYINTAEKVFSEKINKNNLNIALQEFEAFCRRREEEYDIETFNLESVKLILNRMNKLKETES